MKCRIAVLFAVCYLIIVLCSCSEVPGKLLIMEANFLSSQGRYIEAIYSYTKALEYTEAAPYAEYGLGSVYIALGEEKAAMDRFTEAADLLDDNPSAVNRELRYRVHYNTGVLFFSEGDFPAAADSFRKALRINGKKPEAKRNLELSIMSIARQNTAIDGKDEENDGRAAMFEYVRQKEISRWMDMDWLQEEDISGPDY
jgi:Ca-activated chloride channel family protein